MAATMDVGKRVTINMMFLMNDSQHCQHKITSNARVVFSITRESKILAQHVSKDERIWVHMKSDALARPLAATLSCEATAGAKQGGRVPSEEGGCSIEECNFGKSS